MPVAELLENKIGQAVERLDHWLDTMRSPMGYSGPISHWWDSSLVYTGPMLDWRYEGIVCGYLNLFRATKQQCWLDKAIRAAEDLRRGQFPDGHFWNSSFEFGPALGGTPHEAAVDIALLEVARILKEEGSAQWESYQNAAERNILDVLIHKLWNENGFKDEPENDWMVANKNGTIMEALLLYQMISGRDMEKYIEGAAKKVLMSQIEAGFRAGATIHIGTHSHALSFGIYTARCVCALTRLMQQFPREEYRKFILKAVAYLVSLIQPNGTRLGHYRNGRPIEAPLWISPSGEILRALWQAYHYVDVPMQAIETLAWILVKAQQSSGGIPTAYGFSSMGSVKPFVGLPDFRDVLPVTGWCDKAFHALSLIAPKALDVDTTPANITCQWRNHLCRYTEDEKAITLSEAKIGKIIYLWRKGEAYPAVMELW